MSCLQSLMSQPLSHATVVGDMDVVSTLVHYNGEMGSLANVLSLSVIISMK